MTDHGSMRLTNSRARRGPREAAPETAARALRTASAIFPLAGTARPRAAAPTASVLIGAVCDWIGVARAAVAGVVNGTRAPPGTVARPVLVTFAGAATSGGVGSGAGATTIGCAPEGAWSASVESGGGAMPGARVNFGGGGVSDPTWARPTTAWPAPAPSGASVPSDPAGAVEAAAALHRLRVDRAPLAVPTAGGDQDVQSVLDHRHLQQFVVVGEAHADHARGGAAHRAQRVVGRVEPDGLGVLGHQQQVVGRPDQRGTDQLVVVAQVDGDDPAGPVGVELVQPGLLDQPVLGRQHQVRRDLVVRDFDHLGDLLARLEGQQVGHVLALGGPAGLGQLVRLGPVDPALVGEEQHPVVRGRHEEVTDDVVLAQGGAGDALAAALLRAVQVGLGPLGVARTGDRDDHVLPRDEVLHRDLAVERDDLRTPLVAPLRDDLRQLLGDDLPLPLRLGQDVLELGDLNLDLGQLVDDLLALQGGEPAQLHVQDRGGLDLVDVQ